ncbi:pyruvate decarboxylase 1 [Arachis ipaensis]|uniref:pyruvate decarboxylase n=1 Tax=Arachis hypogaea TaxID=3818 RepID=A0A444XKG4_ARAHY|nr:pyruvate decarboxylase 1 [Arachis ipaensis]XP_029151566.1 pyruvate decarboxylase 1 [Arachis hypogaea]QHN77363.1 Pyruvate decarboxylase [Arachis hypogaea]RYQ90168.1 hypothetical protein Ahy_B09g096418 [Arachis hypogaea]
MAEVDEKFWEKEEVDRFSKVQESFLTSSSTLSILEFMLVVKIVILRTFMKINAVVNNLEDAHEMLDTAISTALKESKPVYISISCNLAAIPHPTFSREPVPFLLSPKLSNQMGLEAAVEAEADFHGNMSV